MNFLNNHFFPHIFWCVLCCQFSRRFVNNIFLPSTPLPPQKWFIRIIILLVLSELGIRKFGECVLHKFVPHGSNNKPSHLFFHWCVVVVSSPRSHNNIRCITNNPSVFIIICCACFCRYFFTRKIKSLPKRRSARLII